MRLALFILAMLSAGNLTAAGKDKPQERKIHLQWRDLPLMITGVSVKLALPGGKSVRGDVISVEPEVLILDVKRSSDPRWRKGEATIPRNIVTELRVVKKTGYTWRVVGTVIAGAAGCALGGAIALVNPPAGIAVCAGSAGAGFWGGWASDRTVTVIAVDPGL